MVGSTVGRVRETGTDLSKSGFSVYEKRAQNEEDLRSLRFLSGESNANSRGGIPTSIPTCMSDSATVFGGVTERQAIALAYCSSDILVNPELKS